MELSPRKQAVLAAVTSAYIKTGEPIGSKALTLILKNAPSSATLRSEMSELCDLGLLTQPHTSAGRIPTSRGIKLYVDTLMRHDKISESDKAFIDAGLKNLHAAPEKIPQTAGELLSELTGLPAVSCFSADSSPVLRRVELIPISRNSVLLLLITRDGRARSQIFRTGLGYTPELAAKFSETVSKKVKGKPVNELTRAYMQSVIAGAGADSLNLAPFMSEVFETASGIEESDVTLSGETALYNICESEAAARRILSLINLKEPILSVIDGIDGNSGVVFGIETEFKELWGNTVIAAKYSVKDKFKGAVGLIGPNRISYDRIIPVVEYTALRLSDIMTEAGQDMEE